MDNLEEINKYLEKYNLSKTDPRRSRKYEQSNHKDGNWNCSEKSSPKKAHSQMVSQANFTKCLEKS